MLKEKVNEALNKQLNREYNAFWLYLSASAYARKRNLPGFAHWLERQAAEEQEHGRKIIQYIEDRDGNVVLSAIPEPKNEWNSTIDLFAFVYAHEKTITKKINKIYRFAVRENDPATAVFLQWFVAEQTEEESVAFGILERLKMINEAVGPLFYFDHELGKRK